MNNESDGSPTAVAEPADAIGLDEAVAVRELAPGRYAATVHPSWDGPLTTHGGILAAIILRAVDSHTNAERTMQVRTLACHYLRPPVHGDIEVIVTPLRSGRRFASAAATIEQDGKTCVTALLTHSARGLPDVGRWQPALPQVAPAPLREAPSLGPLAYYAEPGENWLAMPEQALRFFQRLKVAPRFGDMIFMGSPIEPGQGAENGGWLTLPQPRPVDPELLAVFVDAFWPSPMQSMRTLAMSPTIDLTIHFRAVLPPEGLPDQPLLAYNNSIALVDGMWDSDSRIFTAGGELLAQARQLQFVAPLKP
ncbi:MAG: thioesterase family protein [Thermoleophilia bacterium]|nr:thioesterase family protein [Thermoleophilia bacterium]